jgi:hypothetical protein
MAQPSIHHEPTEAADPTATLVDGDTFDRLAAWGAHIEVDRLMGRAYVEHGGCLYATELGGAA